MRYQLNQEILTIRFDFSNKFGSNNKCHFTKPMPWNDTVTKIHLKTLTVSEHHKVPDEWGDQEVLKFDGFILLDDKGNKWYNQYPYASYGQLNDISDAMFNDGMEEVCDAMRFLDDLARAVRTVENPSVLATHYIDVIEEIEKFTGKKIEQHPVVLTTADGKTITSSFKRHTLV